MRQQEAKTLNATVSRSRGDGLCFARSPPVTRMGPVPRHRFSVLRNAMTTRAVNTLQDASDGLRGVRVGETSRPGRTKPSMILPTGVQLE